MKSSLLASAVAVLVCGCLKADGPVQDLLARMDAASASFKAMTAQVHNTTHTAVIDDNSEESGSVLMRKVANGEVQGRIDFLQPDPRTITFEKRNAQVYLPKSKVLQIYDLGSKGEQLDRFLMIGFGTSGSELAHDYTVKISGTAMLNGMQTIKIELVPKAEDVHKMVTKLELWVPDRPAQPYPIQEKIYEPSGDFRLIAYSDLKINPPVRPDALKLTLPPGVKKEYPQK